MVLTNNSHGNLLMKELVVVISIMDQIHHEIDVNHNQLDLLYDFRKQHSFHLLQQLSHELILDDLKIQIEVRNSK